MKSSIQVCARLARNQQFASQGVSFILSDGFSSGGSDKRYAKMQRNIQERAQRVVWSVLLAPLVSFLIPIQTLAQPAPRALGVVVSWGLEMIPYLTPGTTFKGIAAGDWHTVALKTDGSVVAWGDNQFGQSTIPETARTQVVTIAAGGVHTVALKSDGSVVAWGRDDVGQTTAPMATRDGIAMISAGHSHSVALKIDGSVIEWGAYYDDRFTYTVSVPVIANNGVTAIAAGGSHTVALKSDSSVIAWGLNEYGQTSVPPEAQNGVTAIAAGASHTVALKGDGSVIAWGRNNRGQTTVPALAQSGVVAITAGGDSTLALKRDGSVIGWGSNGYGQIAVPIVAQSGVTAIAAGRDHAVALKSDGSLLAWGANYSGQTMVPANMPNTVTAIAAGFDGLLALKSDGTLFVAWGDYDLNDPAVPVGAQDGIVSIAAGAFHPIVLKNNGMVMAWWLQWGGGPEDDGVPTVAQSGVTAIAAGNGHTVALKSDGSVVAWGRNNLGQATVPMAAQSGVIAIAAGGDHTVALTRDGSVVTWGDWWYNLNTVPVAAQSGVMAIGAGWNHTVALKRDGSVVAWGRDTEGQTAVPVAARSGVKAIAAGAFHTVALKSDGSLIGWGQNGSGETTMPGIGAGRVQAIAAGWGSTVALVTTPDFGEGLAILSQPSRKTALAGTQVAFTITVRGAQPVTYQWRKNGVDLPSATGSTLTLNSVGAADSGAYSVLVRNATGFIVSDAAHLAVLAEGANRIRPTQITTQGAPNKTVNVDSLVLVTHGWEPFQPFADVSWVDDMVDAFVNASEVKTQGNWLAMAFKWTKTAALPEPNLALIGGEIVGRLYAKEHLVPQQWKHVHLIGHSAGSAVIEAMAKEFRSSPNPPVIHLTFLDPFTTYTSDLRYYYGTHADWADNYSAFDVTATSTQGNLAKAFNVDVTRINPTVTIPVIGVGFWSISTHTYPHEFYLKSILGTNPTCADGYGFLLSKEGGGWGQGPKFGIGNESISLCAKQTPVVNLKPERVYDYISFDVLGHGTSDFGAFIVGKAGFLLDSLSTQSSLVTTRNEAAFDPLGTEPASDVAAPAWLAVSVPVTNAVNFVQFYASFERASAAEGLLTVYWNTNLVGMVDERVASPGLQNYRFALPATVTNGLYTLSFRLDTFHQTASSLTVTNVAPGFVGVTQPIILEAAGLATNGVSVLKLTAAPDYTYLIQASTNLLNWTPSALLVNTNGTMLFAEPGHTSSGVRFYRATLP